MQKLKISPKILEALSNINSCFKLDFTEFVTKNITLAEKDILTVGLQLNGVGALAYDTVIDVLRGLTNCPVPDL